MARAEARRFMKQIFFISLEQASLSKKIGRTHDVVGPALVEERG